MNVGGETAPQPRIRWFDRRTLRFRLLASVMALVVGACLVLGVVTVFALRSFLVGQLDHQLEAASDRHVATDGDHDGDDTGVVGDSDGDSQTGFGDARGQAIGTLGIRLVNGRLTAIGIVGSTSAPTPSAADLVTFRTLPIGHPHSRDLGPLGDYRLLALVGPDKDRVITALPMHPVNETLGHLFLVEIVVFAVVVAATAAGGLGLVRLSLRPLGRVTATARRVSESPLTDTDSELTDRVPTPDARTEVGALGVAFNHMLDHVGDSLATRQATEERLRRFIADASHELRTPLASIRAHAESIRRSDEVVPESMAVATRRIEAESARMGVLVDDLLLLARLDAGRPLDVDSVDLSRLVIDAASDARAAVPTHRWLLELPEEPVVVTGDAARLHQVLANLLTNAGSYGPPGTTVSIGVRVEGAEVILIVEDDGPGIADDKQAHIFERYFRADTASDSTAPGHGLGLAIVAAVVHAHKGTVSVSSRPGSTRFNVVLPAVRSGPVSEQTQRRSPEQSPLT
jgi:two-component system, OmpR family, sensor kinase